MVRYHNITENSDHSSEEALDLDLPPRPPRLPDQDSNNGKKKAKKNILFKLFCGILGINGIIFILAVIGIILGGYCAVELHSQNLRQNDFDLRLAHVEKKVDEVSDLFHTLPKSTGLGSRIIRFKFENIYSKIEDLKSGLSYLQSEVMDIKKND